MENFLHSKRRKDRDFFSGFQVKILRPKLCGAAPHFVHLHLRDEGAHGFGCGKLFLWRLWGKMI
jgi:hypothetical protein